DDRLERWRLFGRHLQAIEPPPGDTHHADLSVAPGLLGDPGDGIHTILLVLLGVFVGNHTIVITAAAHIDTHTNIAVTRHVSVVSVVTSPGNVALWIGNVLHDRRQRRTFSLLRQPDSSRQLGAATHWNEDVLYFTDLIGKRFDNAHGSSLHSFDRFNLTRESFQAGPVTLFNLIVIITRDV